MEEIFVPGRLCLLGEHSDWAGGYRTVNPSLPKGVTLVCATEEGLFARCHAIAPIELSMRSVSDRGEERTITLSLLDTAQLQEEALKGGFFSYVSGTALEVLRLVKDAETESITHGIEINNYRSTLPMVWGLTLSTEEVMDLAFRGEMRTPSRCGRMDQCVAMGPGKIARMEFDGSKCSLQSISCKTSLHFVVADLNRSKNTIEILRALNSCFPNPKNDTERLVHDYVTANVNISQRAQAAVEDGDALGLGAAMKEAQDLFDRTAGHVCPSELSSPRLHEVLADPDLRRCSISAKGVGSQGDGSVQVLCMHEEDQHQTLRILTDKLGCNGFCLTIPAYKC